MTEITTRINQYQSSFGDWVFGMPLLGEALGGHHLPATLENLCFTQYPEILK